MAFDELMEGEGLTTVVKKGGGQGGVPVAMARAMASCHAVTRFGEGFVGNQVEVRMFEVRVRGRVRRGWRGDSGERVFVSGKWVRLRDGYGNPRALGERKRVVRVAKESRTCS